MQAVKNGEKMANFNYSKLKAISEKLIKQFGVNCEIEFSDGESVYNVETGGLKQAETAKISGFCLFDTTFYTFNSNPENVAKGAVKCYLSIAKNETKEPKLNGFILANSEKWQIINIQPLKPSNLAILYDVDCVRVE